MDNAAQLPQNKEVGLTGWRNEMTQQQLWHNITLQPLGDRAVVLTIASETGSDEWHSGAELAAALRHSGRSWMVDIVPAYHTVTIVYDVELLKPFSRAAARQSFAPYELVCSELKQLLASVIANEGQGQPRSFDIPVWYGGKYGPDIEEASARSGLTTEAFIRMHQEADYTVAMIGFIPGFPYMTGLPGQLAQPRKDMPRASVPAGSVGIADVQMGKYRRTILKSICGECAKGQNGA